MNTKLIEIIDGANYTDTVLNDTDEKGKNETLTDNIQYGGRTDKKNIEPKEETPEDNIETIMKHEYSYPDPEDKNIQYKLYKKREYYYNKIPERPIIDDNTKYDVIEEYRTNTCGRQFALHKHQGLLSNFINPYTPYKGILIFHGLGTGKCIHKDMNVIINNKSQTIMNVWDTYQTNIHDIDTNSSYCIPSVGLFINSYDGNRIIKKQIITLYREKIESVMRVIVLDSGAKIITTTIHKLLTKQSGWTNQFNINDMIAYQDMDDIKYSTINKLYYINYSDYVYDLEIKDTHNYVAENILCHNTCVGVAIAEKFKEQVQKYNTKIYILVPGPILKENWKRHLVKCTGQTYKKMQDKYTYLTEAEKHKNERHAIAEAMQYYKIMSYKSFHKKVIGEKILDMKTNVDTKTKSIYRKNKDGEFERDVSGERIYNLNNTLIIVDEAHNLTDNSQGEALVKIINNSVNLKVVLMTGTPLKNLGSDIIDLINFLRPKDSPMERDKIFNSHKNHLMDFKPDGPEYLKKMLNGYISHVRGSDPLTFAKRIDKGVIPNGLLFTPIIRCYMSEFQKATYDEAIKEIDDSLDRTSSAVANIAFPGLSFDKKTIKGYYGREGINIIKEQLKVSRQALNKKIGEMLSDKTNTDWLYLTNGDIITGRIYKLQYLKTFSTKFYEALKEINTLFVGGKGAQTSFIYSNLVKVGIDVFHQILLQNGYLEYQEDITNYNIHPDTICYYCGKQNMHHISKKRSETSDTTDTESTTIDELQINKHKFYPATFITITGKANDEAMDMINEHKKMILDNVFNSTENKEGKYIKLVLGSRVMNEGVSMDNVGSVHILDVYFHLGKVDQVVGRAIRWCSHYKLMNNTNIWPHVNVYKYAISLSEDKDELSSEEILYKKAELKYLLINKIERIMKEVAIDCPLNIHGNIFNEEVKEYETCDIHGKIKCPAICNYTKCDYKCNDIKLNYEYYDPYRKIYNLVSKKDIDYSTFTNEFANHEIEYAKTIIKELYITSPVNTLKDILNYVKEAYEEKKNDSYDDFFVYRAIDSLIPITENDFNNFKDIIVDKNNTYGYLIYRDIYYIFQPINQTEYVPLYYRINNPNEIKNELSLSSYLKTTHKYVEHNNQNINLIDKKPEFNYDLDYYEERKEYDFVGVIDKNNDNVDVFKIREKIPKNKNKNRGSGIPTQQGTVCATSKTKKELINIASKIGITIPKNTQRHQICEKIQTVLLEKEKYNTEKMTYVRIPKNHPKYTFPYNLVDRVEYIINKIKINTNNNVETEIIQSTSKKNMPIYNIIIKNTPQIKEYEGFLTSIGATVSNKNLIITVE